MKKVEIFKALLELAEAGIALAFLVSVAWFWKQMEKSRKYEKT